MSELGLQPIPDSQRALIQELKGHFLYLMQQATQTKEQLVRFPGTMPLTLSRRHLNMVARNDYVALEKSDGTRYMLLAVKEFVVLIDRRMLFYIVQPNPTILRKGFQGAQENTILDGELTYNIITQKWDYLIYDAVAIDGNLNIAAMGFRARMQAAEQYVAGPRLWAPFCSGLLCLRIKDYYEKQQIRRLFARIKRDPKGHYIYINNDRRDGVICNENDGVIFAPVGMPYQLRNCPALLKWKPPHLNSVDFTLQLERTVDAKRNNAPSVRTFIAYKGERGIVRLREAYFSSKHRQKFTANFEEYHNKVVELFYDRHCGEWQFLRKREDKEGPNFSSTVIDTMETIAESLEREELVGYLEKHSRSIPNSEMDIVNSVAKNVAVCTFRDDYFDNDNLDYLVTTPISLTHPPQMAPPPPKRPRGPRRQSGEGKHRMPNGEAQRGDGHQNDGEAHGRAPVEYSEDV